MKTSEAIELLKNATRDNAKSKVNPNLTRKQTVEIVEGALLEKSPDWVLSDLHEKRVYQAVRDQRCPRYK